jgi:hypothetical protein
MHFAHQAQLNEHVRPLETKMAVGRENDEYEVSSQNKISTKINILHWARTNLLQNFIVLFLDRKNHPNF